MPMSRDEFEQRSASFDRWCNDMHEKLEAFEAKYGRPKSGEPEDRLMIANCETCERKQIPCKSCQESQRAICYRCDGDVDDPYRELVTDWEDVEQRTNVTCVTCREKLWACRCDDPDVDEQRFPR